jgi:nascent polypeptide-associated complex subunit beta
MTMNPEKLAKLQEQVRTGGKGTPRRKVKKVPTKTAVVDDRKLQASLGRLRAVPIPAIEEVNMFAEDGRVLHFTAPRVQGAVQSNVFAVSGHGQEKDLTELLPGILPQLGEENLRMLRAMAEQFQAQQRAAAAKEDGIPDLVEDFEAAGITEKEVEA